MQKGTVPFMQKGRPLDKIFTFILFFLRKTSIRTIGKRRRKITFEITLLNNNNKYSVCFKITKSHLQYIHIIDTRSGSRLGHTIYLLNGLVVKFDCQAFHCVFFILFIIFLILYIFEDERRPAPRSWAVSCVHTNSGPSCGPHCRARKLGQAGDLSGQQTWPN